jgi:hypothetical protein
VVIKTLRQLFGTGIKCGAQVIKDEHDGMKHNFMLPVRNSQRNFRSRRNPMNDLRSSVSLLVWHLFSQVPRSPAKQMARPARTQVKLTDHRAPRANS